MKNWKKGFLLGVTILSTLIFSGCSKNNETSGKSGSISGDITIWEHGTNYEDAGKALTKEFNKKYPDVKVKFEYKQADDYYSLLTTAIQSSAGPDLFWTNGTSTDNMNNFIKQGVIKELPSSVKLDGLAKESLDLVTINKKQYSVPWMSFDARTFFYNKELFEKMNLTQPKNLKEFEQMLPVIKKAGYIPISVAGLNSWSILWIYEEMMSVMYPEYCQSLSADKNIDLTGVEARNVFKKIKDWADKGYFGTGYKGVDGDGAALAFTTGKAAMAVDGSWTISTYQKNNPNLKMGAFHIPGDDGKVSLIGSYGNGYSMNAATKNKPAATAFLKFCTTKKAQEIWISKLDSVSGDEAIPSAKGVATEIAKSDRVFGTWQSLLTPNSKDKDSTAASIWEEDSPKTFSGKMTVDAFMDELASKLK